MVIVEEVLAYHWNIRKTYQTSLYRFNSYHEMNLIFKEFFNFNLELEFIRLYTYTYVYFFKFLKLYTPILYFKIVLHWYAHCCFLWVCLTMDLYFHTKVRDLGPSYLIFDYNPDIVVNLYRTIGPFLLLSWFLWTMVADSVFIFSIVFFFKKFFWMNFTWSYWYIFNMKFMYWNVYNKFFYFSV